VLEKAATIETALGRRVDWEAAAQAVAAGFRSTLGFELNKNGLTEGERDAAQRLLADKYDNPAWNRRRM
jgi:lipoate-protein ligase A